MPQNPDPRRRLPRDERPGSGDDDALTFDTRRKGGRESIPQAGAARPRQQPSDASRQAGAVRPDDARPIKQRVPKGAGQQPLAPTAPARDGYTRPMPAVQQHVPQTQSSPGGPGGPGGPTGPAGRGPSGRPSRSRGRYHLRRFVIGIVVFVLLWGGLTYWAVNTAWSSVHKVNATATGDRPAEGKGRNILMVGSDSRAGLSAAERRRLGTGGDVGARTDSIMVLHLSSSGKDTLLSIPRDSYVPIPGHGSNKINAAYAFGGPVLLATTIERVTGLRIDGFMEIGFGGFAGIVDQVGGVRMCLPDPMKDKDAHINLPAGCQVLDGKNALGYVRSRHTGADGDLGRVKRQRQFLGALMGKVATPTNILLPWKLHSIGSKAGGALTVGKDDSMIGTAKAFWGLRAVAKGDGYSVTVPVSDPSFQTDVGSSVKWDTKKALALFSALKNDEALSIEPDKS